MGYEVPTNCFSGFTCYSVYQSATKGDRGGVPSNGVFYCSNLNSTYKSDGTGVIINSAL
jgi:hypothetical protein